MKWLPSKDNFILWIVILLLVLLFIKNNKQYENNTPSPVEGIQDTIYNYTYIDSIKYNIYYKDSVVLNIKYIYEEEIINSRNLDDSSAVELFKDLCTGYSLYGQDR